MLFAACLHHSQQFPIWSMPDLSRLRFPAVTTGPVGIGIGLFVSWTHWSLLVEGRNNKRRLTSSPTHVEKGPLLLFWFFRLYSGQEYTLDDHT